jgi:hypothetical protein
VALALLPFFGTDFGKGAVRWFRFGFASSSRRSSSSPFFVVSAAWLMAASQDRTARRADDVLWLTLVGDRGFAGDAARLRAGGAGAVRLGRDLLRRRRADAAPRH